MNDRYQADKVKGQTKKSAASAKPKAKAAASVYVRPAGKTKAEKKAIRKQQQAKQRELDRMYYNPPTQEYKNLRRIWWALLISAIVITGISFFGREWISEGMSIVTLVLAYACIIGALYIDFGKIRKVRRAYQAEMVKKNPKIAKNYIATQAANQLAEEKAEKREERKKQGFFGRFKKDKGEEAGQDAAEKAPAEEPKGAPKTIAELKAETEHAKKVAKEAQRHAAEAAAEAAAKEGAKVAAQEAPAAKEAPRAE